MTTTHMMPMKDFRVQEVVVPPEQVAKVNINTETNTAAGKLALAFYRWGRATGVSPRQTWGHFVSTDMDVAAHAFQIIVNEAIKETENCTVPGHDEKHARDVIIMSILFGVYLGVNHNEQK